MRKKHAVMSIHSFIELKKCWWQIISMSCCYSVEYFIVCNKIPFIKVSFTYLFKKKKTIKSQKKTWVERINERRWTEVKKKIVDSSSEREISTNFVPINIVTFNFYYYEIFFNSLLFLSLFLIHNRLVIALIE